MEVCNSSSLSLTNCKREDVLWDACTKSIYQFHIAKEKKSRLHLLLIWRQLKNISMSANGTACIAKQENAEVFRSFGVDWSQLQQSFWNTSVSHFGLIPTRMESTHQHLCKGQPYFELIEPQFRPISLFCNIKQEGALSFTGSRQYITM